MPIIGLPPENMALFSSLQASKDASLGNLNALHLDLDGYNIALDNCTTGHITFDKADFRSRRNHSSCRKRLSQVDVDRQR
jgi:hypothetical protein